MVPQKIKSSCPALPLFALFLLFLCPFSSTHALERISRLGVGLSGQIKNDIPSLSFKLQQNQNFAFGGLLSYSSDDRKGGYGAALKIYRPIFEEPLLTFYSSALLGIVNREHKEGDKKESDTGFQIDFTLGTEFSFSGLESLGFSLEFGLSCSDVEEFVFETVGGHFIVLAFHFYL